MAKSSSNPLVALVSTVIGVGAFLHMLHEAADGYKWAAEIAGSCPWCRLRGNN